MPTPDPQPSAAKTGGRRKKVRRERSAGVVVYRDHAGRREYLLLDYGRHWDYPKGHLENGENDRQAAMRELREETGLSEGVEILPGFCREILYHFRSSTKGLIRKEVAFFVARLVDPDSPVALSHEHVGCAWLTREDAMARLTFDNAKAVLTGAANHCEQADPLPSEPAVEQRQDENQDDAHAA